GAEGLQLAAGDHTSTAGLEVIPRVAGLRLTWRCCGPLPPPSYVFLRAQAVNHSRNVPLGLRPGSEAQRVIQRRLVTVEPPEAPDMPNLRLRTMRPSRFLLRRLSLRLALVLVAIVAVGMGWIANRVRLQQQGVELIRRHGGMYYYDL